MKRRKKILVMAMALILCVIQIFEISGSGLFTQKAKAANGPEDVSGIMVTNASGAAIAVDPAMVMSQVTVSEKTMDSLTFRWDAVPNASFYYAYRYNDISENYEFIGEIQDTAYQFTGLAPGEEVYLAVCAVNNVVGCRSEFPAPVCGYTIPKKVENLTVKPAADKVTLEWLDDTSATGYLIFRADENGEFANIGSSLLGQYTDNSVSAAKTYQYKVVAYAGTTDNIGEESAIVVTSTLPKKPTIAVKGGTNRIRITWKAITGATGYTVYIYQNESYVPLTVLEGKSNVSYVHMDVPNGTKNQYYVTAYRTYAGVNYESAMSNIGSATAVQAGTTSTAAKLYTTQKMFKKSAAYKNVKNFKKKVKYAKSFAIPGVSYTNVAEFGCTGMIPQGITYAKSCFFITAYDRNSEENSVVYVVDKSSKELLTTIVLPNKTHAGGIAFDGTNLWITQASTLRCIPYSQVESAIENEDPYVVISQYTSVIDLPEQAATVTYYKKLLWVASYDELKAGYMVSYRINNKDNTPSLEVLDTIKMPTRVQGIAFTGNGHFLVSRSCQTDAKKRGYMHQIDVYKPNLKKASKGAISLGKVKNTVDMPSMNEEIVVSGSTVYVNYESLAFASATNPMDRVCAFPVNYMTSYKKSKK